MPKLETNFYTSAIKYVFSPSKHFTLGEYTEHKNEIRQTLPALAGDSPTGQSCVGATMAMSTIATKI